MYTKELQDLVRASLGSQIVAGLALHQFRQMYSHASRIVDPRVLYGDLSRDAKMLLRYYRTAGGSGIWRSIPGARDLFLKVPGPVRISGLEGLKQFHQGRAWSHIIPRAIGGADLAANGLWWDAARNLKLGRRPMTLWWVLHARSILLWVGIWYGAALALTPLFASSVVSMIIVSAMTVLELGLKYYLGELTQRELAEAVFATTWAAGKNTFVITGIILAIGLAFPVLLPLLEVVVVSLAVVSVVFLMSHIADLGRRWWAALDERGHLDQFLAELRIFEEFARGYSKQKSGRTREFILGKLKRLEDWIDRIVPEMDLGDVAPEFDYTRYFPDWEWDMPDFIAGAGDAAQAVPEWYKDRFSSLDLNAKEILSDLDLPSLDRFDLEFPDLGGTARSAQNALVSASHYVRSRGNPGSSNSSG